MSKPDAELPYPLTGNRLIATPDDVNSAKVQESGIVLSGTNKKVLTGSIKPDLQTVAAGTASATISNETPHVKVSTDGAQACALTLPEAADNLGLEVIISFETDGGQDVTINRAGSDTLDLSGDTGNTSAVMADAGDTLILKAVSDNRWAVLFNIGATLS